MKPVFTPKAAREAGIDPDEPETDTEEKKAEEAQFKLEYKAKMDECMC